MEHNPKPNVVLGYNHNIKHKDNVYHIQTEDSGMQNPHIITHLYLGGNILATKKTSYADIVHAENLEEIVRELMQEQHKAILRNLVNDVYDELASGGIVEQSDSAPSQFPIQPQAEAASSNAESYGKFPTAHSQLPKQSVGLPSQASTSQPADRAAPAAKLARDPEAAGDSEPASAEASQDARRSGERAGLRDVSGPTIFGEDLITEKSLDEVILGYLSGDSEDDS